MKWRVPAKTFLIGEYASLLGEGAIILTTSPLFELSVNNTRELINIHIESPAGQFWLKHLSNIGFKWQDPYLGLGGLGASSAQFLGIYLAYCYFSKVQFDENELLTNYFHCAYLGEGSKPSGYDVLAQTMDKCVYINRNKNLLQSYTWPFTNLGFLLIHTNKKLATHEHLKNINLPTTLPELSELVKQAHLAFEAANANLLIKTINEYQRQLEKLDLSSSHCIDLIQGFREDANVLAVKGCGALGADLILLIMPLEYIENKVSNLQNNGFKVLATHVQLYRT